MSLGKKTLRGLGYVTAYTAPENKRAAANVIVNAQEGAEFKIISTDSIPSPIDLDVDFVRQDFIQTGSSNQYKGYSVAVDGPYAVVGAPGIINSIQGRVYIYFFNGDFWVLHATLTPPNGGLSEFGYSVAISGNRVIVGEPGSLGQIGQAYAYNRSGSLQFIFTSPTGTVDRFGESVAIAGDYVVIGAPSYSNNNQIGRAYGYRYSLGSSPQVTYTSPTNSTDSFGQSVAVWEDGSAVISAFRFLSGVQTGRAYYYAGFGSTLTQTIQNPESTSQDRFGISLACSRVGDMFAIGADGYSAGLGVGRVYIYKKGATEVTLLQTLESPEPQNGSSFGRGLGMDSKGNLLVGSYLRDTPPNSDSGTAYLYVTSDDFWTLSKSIPNPSANPASDYFGFSLGIARSNTQNGLPFLLAIGAYQEDTVSTSNSGAVYLYAKGTNTQGQQIEAVKQEAILDDVQVSARDTFERTGLVVDPGESIVVLTESLGTDLRITVQGFEEDI